MTIACHAQNGDHESQSHADAYTPAFSHLLFCIGSACFYGLRKSVTMVSSSYADAVNTNAHDMTCMSTCRSSNVANGMSVAGVGPGTW